MVFKVTLKLIICLLAVWGSVGILFFATREPEQRLHYFSVLLGVESTKNAPFFSLNSFDKIEPGMKEEEVIRSLGPPLWAFSSCLGKEAIVEMDRTSCRFDIDKIRCHEPTEIRMTYSFQDDSTKNFWSRGVILMDGKVVRKWEEYQLD